LRRLPERLAPWRDRTRAGLSHSHLRQVCRQFQLTHVLEICVHRQPFPHLGRLTAGVVHDLDYADRGSSPLDEIFRVWMKQAARLYTNSSQTRAELLELDPTAGPRIEVVLQASTPVQAPPAGLANPWARSEPVLYYPANATWHKGHNILLAALARLAGAGVPFHCFLSGLGTNLILDEQPTGERSSNDVRLNCVEYREALRGRVTLLGRQPWAVVEQLYQAANLVVLPTRFEGFGLPLSEALRRDRPVIASRLAPMEEQVEFYGAAGQVRWVPPGEVGPLADALGEFLSGCAPFPKFPEALRARVAHWNWEAIARQMLAGLAATP
jgi:glycosyltransferase involved in cell wall biosynthesis